MVLKTLVQNHLIELVIDQVSKNVSKVPGSN